MALFSRKTTKKTEAKADATPVVKVAGLPQSLAHVLQNPRITEKASMAMEGFVYTFEVATSSNKKQIAAAVKALYKVTPRKIAIVNVKPKEIRNMRTGKKGMRSGMKKAYVYLNKGETITIA